MDDVIFDIMVILDWLSQTKTPPIPVLKARERLHDRVLKARNDKLREDTRD